jgi:hypothetical protein
MIRTSRSSRARVVTVAALGPVLALSLVACGGGSSGSAASGSSSTPTATATGAPGGSAARGSDFAKIQACLSAAGIAVPTRSNFPRPSGSFTRPSGAPNGTRPSAGVRPSGGRGFGGGGAGMFASAQVKAALKACGLTIPTGGTGGRSRPTAAATAAA